MMGLFEPRKLGERPVVSLPVVLLSVAMCYVALSRSAAAVELSFERAAAEQLWRLLGSVVAVEGWLDLLLNVGYLLVLMRISEAAKGSLFYALDAAAKVLLLNCASLLLFAAARALPGARGGFLQFLVQLQVACPNRGFGGLFALELFLRLTQFRAASTFCVERRLTALLLNLCFAALCLARCLRLELPAALAVGVCLRLPWLNYLELLYKLNCLHQLDRRLLFARRLLFLRSAQREGRAAPGAAGGYAGRKLEDSAEHRLDSTADVTLHSTPKSVAARRELAPPPAPPARDRFALDNYEV